MRGGEGFILVYSVTEKRSFQEMRRFKETVDRVRNYEKVPIVLIGNKSDLERKREVSQQPIQFLKAYRTKTTVSLQETYPPDIIGPSIRY